VNAETLLALEEARGLFVAGRDVVVARAPGRLDVMGGIADYSGSLVLQLPLAEATYAALQRDPEPTLRLASVGSSPFEVPLSAFASLSYEDARAFFRREPATSWAAYAAGAFVVLRREKSLGFAEGARILIASDVPAGKGVSSSAALEVAVLTVIAAAFRVALEPRDTALLCQKVENLVVGAPCGVMDQMTAVCGEKDRLLALLCQPAELRPSVAIPDDVAFYGIDSGERHAVSGSDYTSVRVAAFMGHRMLGLGEDDYLANLTPADFERRASVLPDRMRGRDFLDRYGETADPVTRVDTDREYSVRVCTAHPVYENARVHRFAELLARPSADARDAELGRLMYESHASYGACGLGSPGTDRIVALARAAAGIFGAKITGGGSGGTVALLARRDAIGERAVQNLAATKLFSGSSSGAAATPAIQIRYA
jgi:L-arabinokinase